MEIVLTPKTVYLRQSLSQTLSISNKKIEERQRANIGRAETVIFDLTYKN